MEKGYWINEESVSFLKRGYLREDVDVYTRIRQISEAAEKILDKPGFANKFEDYVLRGFYSLSSPIWANFGETKGLPISCNNSYFEDSIESILFKTAEIGQMTKFGAGTSAYLGDLRPKGSPISVGGVSYGPVHFMDIIEIQTSVISQSNVRRGSCAVYIPVEHPDILDFLGCREEGSTIQNLSLGICLTDEWLESMMAGDKSKRDIWAKIIKKRFESGYPYLFFTDTVNREAPDAYKKHGRKILSSNLCTEVFLSSTKDESFVCDLSSMNILTFDLWKNTDAVETLVDFLDAVMTEYIDKIDQLRHTAPKSFLFMESAYNFAVRQRAIGIGTLGWHSFLQSKMIPFESDEARILNMEIHRLIFERAMDESKRLAEEFGEPEMLKGFGRRNMTVTAIAPTTSSSFILGQVSPSIEPLNSNYFIKDLAKGKFTYKNIYLENVLALHGRNDYDTWRSILVHGGSVQHLDFLSKNEKDVFKTFGEIDQRIVIDQAAERQLYLDQGQSLNLMIHPDTSPKTVSDLLLYGWKSGLKSFYYQRSSNVIQELTREQSSCKTCEV